MNYIILAVVTYLTLCAWIAYELYKAREDEN